MGKGRVKKSRPIGPATRLEEAAGGAIVAREGDALRLVLIATRRDASVRWSLPKGHFERDETVEQAALREAREETGLEVDLVGELGTVDYWFTDGDIRYHKFVHFFVMRPVGGDLSLHDDEVVEARWFAWEDALKHMAYPSERELIASSRERVLELISAV
jgi:8-oxo-dGTP pyrophosphatase MutT (NUDIX family)